MFDPQDFLAKVGVGKTVVVHFVVKPRPDSPLNVLIGWAGLACISRAI
jgi:hypothetical protein